MDAIFERLAGTYCCLNDELLTLENSMTKISYLTGYTPEEIQTHFQNQLIQLVVPEERQFIRQQLTNQLSCSKEAEVSFHLCHKDGSMICVLNKSHLVSDKDGQEYLYGMLTDITRSKEHQTDTLKALEQYRIILAQTENIIFEWDFLADTIIFSNTWQDIFGYHPITEGLVRNIRTSSHIHPEDISLFLERLQELQNGGTYETAEVRIAKADGSYLWCRIRATAVSDSDGTLIKVVGIIVNIDSEKRAAYALLERAEQDALTKLLNHDTARTQCEEYLRSSSRTNCALLVIDLDNFKYINDHFGHMFGDSILKKAAAEIKKLFRTKDIVARIGGDEFLVLMKDVENHEIVKERCQHLISSINAIPLEHPSSIRSSCSIGVAFAPIHGVLYHDLFLHADQALYRAKRLGRNRYSIYESEEFSDKYMDTY